MPFKHMEQKILSGDENFSRRLNDGPNTACNWGQYIVQLFVVNNFLQIDTTQYSSFLEQLYIIGTFIQTDGLKIIFARLHELYAQLQPHRNICRVFE